MQTLHPQHFDRGTILAQTPYPGFEHGCSTVPELLTLMACKGAKMLVRSIRDRLYLLPAKNSEALQDRWTTVAARAAPKIKTQDRLIDWNTWTAEVIIRRQLVIGPLWSFARNGQNVRRLIWTTGFTISEEVFGNTDLPVGRMLMFYNDDCANEQAAYMRTCDDRILKVDKIKIAGGIEDQPLRAAKKADMVGHKTRFPNCAMTEFLTFGDPPASE